MPQITEFEIRRRYEALITQFTWDVVRAIHNDQGISLDDSAALMTICLRAQDCLSVEEVIQFVIASLPQRVVSPKHDLSYLVTNRVGTSASMAWVVGFCLNSLRLVEKVALCSYEAEDGATHVYVRIWGPDNTANPWALAHKQPFVPPPPEKIRLMIEL